MSGARSQVAEAIAQAGRDARALIDTVRGRRASPVVQLAGRVPRVHRIGQGSLTGRAVRVTRVTRETDDAVTLAIEDVAGAPISFVPGQFLTVLVEVGGETLRRAYSISSIPSDGEVTITVKRIARGRASGALVEGAREGDVLRVFGPSGAFSVALEPARARRYLLIAGGSGVTPLFGIMRAILRGEPRAHVTLLYANRRIEDVIFRERIDALARDHTERLTVRHILETSPAREGWLGGIGRLDREVARHELERLALSGEEDILLCGPTPMMEAIRAVLAERGVASGRVREERYTSPELRAASRTLPVEAQSIVVRTRAGASTLTARPGETVLEAATRTGVTLPFSCAMGGCGACKVRVLSGEIAQPEPSCLTEDERSSGLALTCVGHAMSAVTLEVP